MSYGRLADPHRTLGTDPRSDPRMVKAFAQFGLDGPAPAIPLTVGSPLEDRRAFAAMNEEGIGAIFEAFANGLPAVEGVATTTSRSTSAAPRTPTGRCRASCTCTGAAWPSAARPTPDI
jgi:acetyl esterase